MYTLSIMHIYVPPKHISSLRSPAPPPPKRRLSAGGCVAHTFKVLTPTVCTAGDADESARVFAARVHSGCKGCGRPDDIRAGGSHALWAWSSTGHAACSVSPIFEKESHENVCACVRASSSVALSLSTCYRQTRTASTRREHSDVSTS